MSNNITSVGGMALPAGVLMRGKRNAAAVRKADGGIYVKTWESKDDSPLSKVPVIRGIVSIGKAFADGAVTAAHLARFAKDADKTGPRITKLRKYHGAEHKAIACYEQGLEMTVENVRKQSRIHPRCGTSVAVTVLITHALMTSLLPHSMEPRMRDRAELAATVLTFGLSYELNRKAWRGESRLAKKLTAPGKWVQKLTTCLLYTSPSPRD